MSELNISKPEGFRHYEPHKSSTAPETLREFLSKPVSPMLKTIPGIGSKNEEILRRHLDDGNLRAITTSYELIGKFLSFKGEGIDASTHCEKFYWYLHEKGVSSHINDIVQAVSELSANLIPTLCYEPMKMPYASGHVAHKEVPMET